MFLTAGSLAEEKKDGTAWTVFLTDLKGYDVVLGSSLPGSEPLLCVFRIGARIGVPLLLGGVTGSEFWRTALALGNADLSPLQSECCFIWFPEIHEAH